MEEVMERIVAQKYSSYKNSGEDWLGEIPEHWEVKKLKHIFFEKKHKTNHELNSGSISFGQVVEKDDEKIPLSTKASYQEVLKGEFLINPLNLNYDLISLRIALSYINVVVSSGYIVLKNLIALDKEYFKYLLHRYDVAYMKLLGSGVRQTISFNHIANSLLIFPPIKEQTRIAQFLNRKTAQIDQAIAQKENQIELLKERRQILIHKAVTRGLNPNVKLKDSSVEWIGEISSGWTLISLRRLTVEHKQGYYSESGYVDSGYKLIRITDLNGEGEIDTSSSPYVNPKVKELELFQVRKGDFLFPRTGTIGLLGVAKQDMQAVFASYLIRFRFSNLVNTNFLRDYFVSDLFLRGLKYDLHGGVVQNIHAENIKNQVIPLPPLEEQEEISKYISDLSSRYSKVISIKENEIQHLKEYRSSMINSAITGKIKV